MKYIKKYERMSPIIDMSGSMSSPKIKVNRWWYQDESNIGNIIKRKAIDDRSYNLFLLTDLNLDENKIMVLPFGYCSLDFDSIHLKFYSFKDAYVYEIDNWFKNEYSLLTKEETDKLYQEIENYDNEDYFEKIKKLTNIELKDYPMYAKTIKYNL